MAQVGSQRPAGQERLPPRGDRPGVPQGNGLGDSILPGFPDHWGYRRIAECKVAAYAYLFGLMLFVLPETLSSDVYASLGGEGSARILGTIGMAIGALHSWALWLNGSSPRVSRAVRMVACGAHAGFVSFFLWYFALAGANWRALLMIYVLIDVYFALSRACLRCRSGRQ